MFKLKFKFVLVLISRLLVGQTGRLHMRFHGAQVGPFYQHNSDTLYVPLRVANTSKINAI